jgi:hypothetical protein
MKYTGIRRVVCVVALALTLSCSVAAYAQQTPKIEFDFRRTNWGMTRDEVKATEFGEPAESDENLIVYTDVVGGYMEALVAYVFADGKLVQAKYLFLEEHADPSNYISEYERVKQTLTLKYGPPKSDEEIWHNNTHKDMLGEWGLAVKFGHLAYRAGWETGTTEIVSVLNTNGKDIVFGVVYSGKKAEIPKQGVKDRERGG